MKKFILCGFLSLIALVLFGVNTVVAETDPRFYAVEVSAQVNTSPAQIVLSWTRDDRATGYTVSRKNFSDSSWNQVANLGGSATSYTDSNVSVGSAFEYRVLKNTSIGYKGSGYIYAGINAPLKDTRGKVILLVDNLYAGDLSAELKRLEWDLAGDGWTVMRRDVSRNDSPTQVKSIIKGLYNSDPSNTKAVFLFGHIAVPYSGNFTPDGHPDHQGAWPADLYYGDMDGNWTDSSTYSGGANRPANQNRPGDGKFDQSDMPSNVEIAVGRVDFHNMTCFANKSPSRSEKDLLRNYLNKDHNFRHRVFTVERRGMVCDNFGERNGEAFASSGWRNFAPMFGAQNNVAVGGWQYFPTVKSQGYLWSYGTGGGSFYTCNGVGGSDDFATSEIKSVFTMFLGSYFGDWDNESNFLRASLGSGYCLTTSWSGRPHWFYHHMALGEHIGYSTVLSQNNSSFYENKLNTANRQVHQALLGDPTLRMHPVVPPGNVNGSVNGSTVSLNWGPSSDSDLQGYHVYRGTSASSSFTRLTSNPIGATSFVDTSGSGGYVYMVRAVKLERSGSGSYYNASQGVFFAGNGGSVPTTGGSTGSTTSITTGSTTGNTIGSTTGSTTGGTSGGNGIPTAPSALAAKSISSSQINLVWVDTASTESGFRIERKTGSNGPWIHAGNAGANATSFNNTGLASGTQYYYRVIAQNVSGNSPASNEAGATTVAPNSTTTTSSATFISADSVTRGSWKGVYGANGYQIIGDAADLPEYVTLATQGADNYQWTDTSSDIRALQRAEKSGRIAACWYSSDSYNIEVNFIDGIKHRLSIYFLDWDRSGRTQTVEILDAGTGAVLNTQTVSGFADGKYLTWEMKGSIRIRMSKVTGINTVAMGLFFDPATAALNDVTEPQGRIVNGKFQMEIKGTVGQKFDVYASSNLTSWTKVSTIALTSSAYNFVDTNSTATPFRFYRAVAVP